MITLHATVHDGGVTLLRDAFSCHVVIDPIWIAPHAGINLPKLYRSAGVIGHVVLEGLFEIAVVKEHIWVVEPSVKVSLYRLDRLYDAIYLFIPCENNEGGVRSRAF